jgi:hypothetical protein
LQDEVASLTRTRDLSERAYKAGAFTLTDVLDADRQLLVARDDLDNTRSIAVRTAVSTFGPSMEDGRWLWMSRNSVILAFNYVLNRKFGTLVDDRGQVSTGDQQVIDTDQL